MAATLYKSFGPKLVGQGYDITPVVGKKPILEAWTTRPGAALDYTLHSEKSIGVLLGGRHNLVAVDVDVLNPFCSNDLEKLVEEELGSAPKRIGKAPKFLMLFRCTELQKKIRTGVYEIDGVDAATELLGEGQQFVAAGVHPDTGSRYVWPGDKLIDIAPEELTEVTPDALRRFLAMASSVMATYGELKGRVSDRGLTTAPQSGLNLKELRGKAAEVEAAVMHIPNDDEHYDDWVQTAHAIKGAIGDSGFDLFCRWSARSAKDDLAQNERLWQSIGQVKHIGAGSLYHWARQYGFDLATYREPQHVGPKDAPAQADDGLDEWESVDEDGVVTVVTPNTLTATPLGIVDPKKIPPRPWLFGDQLLTGYVTAFVAPPGVGKSTLTIQIAAAIATGKDFAEFKCHSQGNTWIYNNEDDRDELHRRVAAAMRHMGIKPEDIADKMFMDTGDERSLMVARLVRNDAVVQTPDVEACIAEIKRNDIKLFVVDPFAETHTVNENSNDHIKQVAGMFRYIAKRAGCAVLLVHHTRKGNGDGAAGDMDAARGAGALLGVCRVVSTMFAMSKADAESLGVQEDTRHMYVRFDGAKANLSLVTSKARWFKRESVDLANSMFGEGDKVGVLTPWSPPGPLDGVSPADIRAIQIAVAKRDSDGDPYRENVRSGDAWIGVAIAEQCGLDPTADRKRLTTMFKIWVDSGCFEISEALVNRNKRTCVFVKDWVQLG